MVSALSRRSKTGKVNSFQETEILSEDSPNWPLGSPNTFESKVPLLMVRFAASTKTAGGTSEICCSGNDKPSSSPLICSTSMAEISVRYHWLSEKKCSSG